jgi:uncharacterized protein YkwD
MLHRSLLLAISGAIAAVLVAAGWTFAASQPASALSNCDTSEAGITPAEQQMLDLINNARAQAGVQPLKLSSTLNRSAAWLSTYVATTGIFDHFADGRSPSQRAKDCGYPGTGAGENLAMGYGTPADIFALWMGSPGHRANILLAGYTVVGIGQHGTAWTTDFGYTDDSGVVAPPPSTTTPQPTATATNTAFPTAATAQPTNPPTATPTATPSPTASPTPSPTATPHIGGFPSALSFRATVPQLTHD